MNQSWTDEELIAAIQVYLQMQQAEAEQKPYSKREYYRQLSAEYGRSEKSYEYRMQNISAVLDQVGEAWIPGLKPAGNVGANVQERILQLFKRLRMQVSKSKTSSAPYKKKIPDMRTWLIQVARARQKVTYGDMMNVFDVDWLSLRHAMDFLGHQADNLDEPIITALIVSKDTHVCSGGFEKEFGISDDEAERERLYQHWESNKDEATQSQYDVNNIESKALKFAVVASRPDQALFRKKIFLEYNGKCVISGCDISKALDAAHKHNRDWRLGHNQAADGLLLRKDLHALYDNHLLTVSAEGKVSISHDAKQHYKEFDGIYIPTK